MTKEKNTNEVKNTLRYNVFTKNDFLMLSERYDEDCMYEGDINIKELDDLMAVNEKWIKNYKDFYDDVKTGHKKNDW
ncbi:MAG: hypothetical protein WCX32_03375 [Clostridia bacterium]|jgi:hypothetical protein|nr:hypothetical protein [Clostridia bacterium]